MAVSDNFHDEPQQEEDLSVQQSQQPEKTEAPPIADHHWEAALGAWLDRLRNGPIAHTTEAWNQLVAEVPKLRDLLHKAMKGS